MHKILGTGNKEDEMWHGVVRIKNATPEEFLMSGEAEMDITCYVKGNAQSAVEECVREAIDYLNIPPSRLEAFVEPC